MQQLKISFENAVKVNNQNTTLLEYYRDNHVFIFHDNRIYVFYHKKDDLDVEMQMNGNVDVSSVEQNIILNLLMTTWVRLINIIYMLLRLFDNTALAIIVVLSILSGTFITTIDKSDLSLFSIIGLEMFYDVILSVNRYWTLQRLSFYIGIVLYIGYFAIVLYQQSINQLSGKRFKLVIGVLLFRLYAFLLEVLTDIGMDYCIHNMLIESNSGYTVTSSRKKKNRGNMSLNNISLKIESSVSEGNMKEMSMNNRWLNLSKRLQEKYYNCFFNRYILPTNIEYKGSFNAWGKYSVKKWLRDNKNLKSKYLEPINKFWMLIVFLLPTLVSSIFVLCLMIIVFLAIFILTIFMGVIASLKLLISSEVITFDDIADLFEEFVRL